MEHLNISGLIFQANRTYSGWVPPHGSPDQMTSSPLRKLQLVTDIERKSGMTSGNEFDGIKRIWTANHWWSSLVFCSRLWSVKVFNGDNLSMLAFGLSIIVWVSDCLFTSVFEQCNGLSMVFGGPGFNPRVENQKSFQRPSLANYLLDVIWMRH